MFISERQTGSRRLVHLNWLLAGFWITHRHRHCRPEAGRADEIWPPGNSPTASPDVTFGSHAVVIIAHILLSSSAVSDTALAGLIRR